MYDKLVIHVCSRSLDDKEWQPLSQFDSRKTWNRAHITCVRATKFDDLFPVQWKKISHSQLYNGTVYTGAIQIFIEETFDKDLFDTCSINLSNGKWTLLSCGKVTVKSKRDTFLEIFNIVIQRKNNNQSTKRNRTLYSWDMFRFRELSASSMRHGLYPQLLTSNNHSVFDKVKCLHLLDMEQSIF